MIIFGAAWYSYGECARKLGIAALIMAVLIIAGLILQRKREYYEYKKEYIEVLLLQPCNQLSLRTCSKKSIVPDKEC